MKILRWLCMLAVVSVCAYGQGGRFGDQNPTQTVVTIPGTIGQVVKVIPNANVNFCTAPANAVPCTNKATTYTDITLGTQCSTSTQVVLAGSSSCVGTSDSLGNWGVWVQPGYYEYTITVSGNGTSYGPFPALVFASTGTGGPSINCVGVVNGALAAWLSATNVGCDNQSLTDFVGNLRSQSYQALGPRNGEVWLTSLGTPNSTTLPANTIGLVTPNSVPTSARLLVPPGIGTDGQVLQQLNHGVDATGTNYATLNWLTPSLGSGSTNFVNEVPSGTVNGSNVTFTLSQTPNPVGSFMLWRNGQLQGSGGVDYTLSGTTITYAVAPITSDTLYAFYARGPAIGNNDALAQTCTNQVLTAVDTTGTAGNCKTLTSAYVNNTIALTGTDINTSNQVTVTHLAAALPVAQGGTGAATLTVHGVVVGNTTSAVNVTSAGTSGQVLTSNGPSADPTYQAAGSSSSGPVLDYTQCFNDDTGGGGLSSIACSSTINVSVGDILLSFCSFATNDGGTVTLAMSSSPAETWTTDITAYSANSTDRSSAFRTTATSSGAYTFTCTPSSSKPFPTLTVVKVTGITGLDTSGSRGTTSSTTHIGSTLTTTVGSDLVFMFTGAVGGNEGNCTSIWVGGFNLQARTDIAMYLGAKKLGAAGTYTFTAISCSNNAYGTVSVAYK